MLPINKTTSSTSLTTLHLPQVPLNVFFETESPIKNKTDSVKNETTIRKNSAKQETGKQRKQSSLAHLYKCIQNRVSVKILTPLANQISANQHHQQGSERANLRSTPNPNEPNNVNCAAEEKVANATSSYSTVKKQKNLTLLFTLYQNALPGV